MVNDSEFTCENGATDKYCIRDEHHVDQTSGGSSDQETTWTGQFKAHEN